MRAIRALAAVAVAALLVSGCARSPRVNFYTLSAQGVPAQAASEQAGPSVVVGPVTVPEVVDRPQLVVRVDENRVEVLESHRWAEPLKSEIPRIMAAELGRFLGSSRVASYRQSTGADADYRVVVDITRMEAVPGEAVIVEAAWVVRRGAALRRIGRSVAREKVSGGGYEAVAAAYSRALAGVSADIAREIATAPPRPQ